MNKNPNEIEVKGKTIDNETRCVHYHSPIDIIAIKFKCCKEYYPCYQCHEEEVNHPTQLWSREEWNEKVILCGACKIELPIRQYMDSGNHCPNCGAAFNPNCRSHYHLYFGM